MNILGSNNAKIDDKIILVDTEDIAEIAAEELLNLDFSGHPYRYIASDERTGAELAKVLGKAVNKPDLSYVEFSDGDTYHGLIAAGLPEEIAKNYTELGNAMRTGRLGEDYSKNPPAKLGKTKLEDFAEQFAVVYHGGSE